jgi:hypothetical protein
MGECEYEFVRRQMKKEVKSPNRYTRNRVQALLERIQKKEGDRAVKEIAKEFRV